MKRTSIILIVAASLATIAWGIFASIVFVTGSHNDSLAERVAELEFQLLKDEHSRSLAAIIEDTADERAALATRMVKADSVVDFIKGVEAFSRVSGAKLSIDGVEIKPRRDADPSEPIELLSVRVSAEGRWAQVMHLVALVEALPQKTDMERVSFTSAGKGVWTAALQFDVAKEKGVE